MKSKKYVILSLFLFCSILYFIFAYHLERTQFSLFLTLWMGLFIGFFGLIKLKIDFKVLAIIAFVFRIIILFSVPNLSQDYYRFIWDGRMILEGLNPYLSLPQTFINEGAAPVTQAAELYKGMGDFNGSHFTNYPPLNQICFSLAALFAGKSILGSVIVMRIIIILSDLGILYFGIRLLKSLNLSEKNIFLYLLNPFVIIELTGNLHFESVMLFFLVLSLYQLQRGKWIWAAMLLAFSISLKLIPLIFLPLFYQWFMRKRSNTQKNWMISGFSKLSAFYIIILGTSLLLFLPFFSPEFINNYIDSVGLWFNSFEFNASIYYIFREIGYAFRDYNEIGVLGKLLPAITFLLILLFTFIRENKNVGQLITAMLLCITVYYFLSTTVHPWYIATPLLLCVFTNFRFGVIWSATLVLSYQAYANTYWQENLWIVALEYAVVFGFLLWELINRTILSKDISPV